MKLLLGGLLLRVLLLQIILLSSTLVAEENPVVSTLQHCNKFSSKNDLMGYLSRDLALELGRRLSAPVMHVTAPLKRCLGMMKSGQVDFMFAPHISDERAIFMEFIQSSKVNQIVFLIRKKDGDWLHNYSDLANKTLGVVDGADYFPKLNTDNKLNKQLVINPTQLPKILLAGRVDAFVAYKATARDILLAFPDIAQASYNVGDITMGFLAISKESPLRQRLDELNRIIVSMIDDGYYDKKIEQYLPGVILPFSKRSSLTLP
jgi:polar amino acid transport system substrate-binding protein